MGAPSREGCVVFVGEPGAAARPGVARGVVTFHRQALELVANQTSPPRGRRASLRILAEVAREHDLSETTRERPLPQAWIDHENDSKKKETT